MYSKSLPCQLALVQTRSPSTQEHLISNPNLHLQTAYAMLDYDYEHTISRLSESIYGSGRNVRDQNRTQKEFNPVDLTICTTMQAVTGDLGKLPRIAQEYFEKELDDQGIQAWTLFLTLYGTWQRSIQDLLNNIKLILK